MSRFPEGHELQGVKDFKRATESTVLKAWMVIHRVTAKQVARGVGCSDRAIKYWICGQNIPDLVMAFKIEAFTKGKVPVASWLGTTIAKARWNNITIAGKRYE